MDSFEVLISLLSVVLIILLALLIVAVVYIIKLLKQVRHISQTASNVMDNVKTASAVFKNSAAPVAVSRIIANVIDMWRSPNKKQRKE